VQVRISRVPVVPFRHFRVGHFPTSGVLNLKGLRRVVFGFLGDSHYHESYLEKNMDSIRALFRREVGVTFVSHDTSNDILSKLVDEW